jgi:hypothetical protein
MRNSFIFYRSFYEAISKLPKRKQLIMYQAIAEYSLDFKEPQLDGVCEMLWGLIKPNLSANNERFLNGMLGKSHGIKGKKYGKLGGRPRVEKPPKNPPQNPPNKDVDKDKDKEVKKNIKKKKQTVATSLTDNLDEPTMVEISRKHKISLKDVEFYKESYIGWIEEKPRDKSRAGRNMKATVSNWIRRDIRSGKLNQKLSLEDKFRAKGIRIVE